MVSDDGQISAYTTCLLRLMGYGNVYSMRWGMSAWNEKYAKEGWLSGVSGKYEDKLETKVNERPAALGMPDLRTNLSTGAEMELPGSGSFLEKVPQMSLLQLMRFSAIHKSTMLSTWSAKTNMRMGISLVL